MAHDVFICYSSMDKPAADAACAALEARAIRCWIAPRDIQPSQNWAAAIAQAIRGARIVLVVFSREANESEQVRREVELAASSAKQILVLRVEDSLPDGALTITTPHWLDAVTPPFEAHLQKLADECVNLLAQPDSGPAALAADKTSMVWWRRQHPLVKIALLAVVVLVLAAGVGITGQLLGSSPSRNADQSDSRATAVTTSAVAAPPPDPAVILQARTQIVQITGSWSDDGFHKAVRDRDLKIVGLYLQSGMEAKTLYQGASVILYGFQGLQQDGDPVELMKTFQAAGFKVDDELEDSFLMDKLSVFGPRSMLPMPFKGPLAPKGYAGGYGGTFVGSLLFWIVQRSTWVGTDEDNQVMKYLIDQGADCKVPLAFLDYQQEVDLPQHQLMKSCAK
jgi:hypothetical protein